MALRFLYIHIQSPTRPSSKGICAEKANCSCTQWNLSCGLLWLSYVEPVFYRALPPTMYQQSTDVCVVWLNLFLNFLNIASNTTGKWQYNTEMANNFGHDQVEGEFLFTKLHMNIYVFIFLDKGNGSLIPPVACQMYWKSVSAWMSSTGPDHVFNKDTVIKCNTS